MESILTFSVSWRTANSGRIAAWTLPTDNRALRLERLCAQLGVREVVYLATCNRVEITVVAPDADAASIRGHLLHVLLPPDDHERGHAELRVWGGEGALEHLMVVAAGLDSAQLGEREISGQIRRALREAEAAGTLGPMLRWAFDQALHVSKRVQSSHGLREGRTSLAEIALDPVREALAAHPGTVALVGVSPMTRRIAESLPGEGLLFVNRTLAHAEELAATHGASAMSLRAFIDAPPAVRAVVSATGAPTAILSFPTLRALAAAPHPPILLDLAVPPDIDPGAAAALGLIRWDMDTINAEAARNSARRAEQGVEAREMIDAALDDVSSKATARALSPLLAELYTVYKETADRAVDRVMARDLAGLPPEARDAVSRFGQDLARRLAHLPASGLRALATEGGMEPVRAFLTSPNDPMTQRLSRVARQSDEGAD